MKFDYLVPCLTTSLDQNTNSISIFNTVERISVSSENLKEQHGTINYQIHFLAVLSRESEVGATQIAVDLLLKNPKGKISKIFSDLSIPMPANLNRMRVRGDVALEIHEAGDHFLIMQLKQPNPATIEYRIEVALS